MSFSRGLIQHPDGIYLGLSHKAHLADGALGYSAVKQVAADPPEWWWESAYNTLVPPKPESDDEKRWSMLGNASHTALLESLAKYEFAYAVKPTPEDFPDALFGVRQLQAKCKELGLRADGTMEDMERRIRQADPTVETFIHLWDLWKDSGRTGLKFEEDVAIRLLHRMAQRSADEIELAGGERITLRAFFEGGLSEVSVFWTDENGIRMRARFDKLKPNMTGDFKTIGRKLPNFRKALLKEIKSKGYIFQPPHYDEARRQLPRLIAEGKVFGGTDEERAILEECAAAEEWSWVFVFGKLVGAPQLKGIRIDKDDPVYRRAESDRAAAIDNFLYHREIFGLEEGRQWFDPQVIWKPDAQDWPIFDDVE